MTIFSKRLIAARKSRRLSQSELGRRTRLKQCAISHFETGRRSPSFDNLKRLADALEVTTDYLIGRAQAAKTSTETVSELLRDQQKLSSKDVKFLQRLANNLIRRKNR